MDQILEQGLRYINSRKKTCATIYPSLSLIENFESNEVATINNIEHKQLEIMQQNYKLLLIRWEKQYDKVINYVKEPHLKKCINKCLKHDDIDKRTACLYGCNIGKFANSSVDQRITADKPPDEILANDATIGAAAALVAAESIILLSVAPFIGAAAGIAADIVQHNNDDLSSTVHPEGGTTIIENFETNAARGIDVADGLTGDGRGYSTKKWKGANAPQTTARGQNYNKTKYTDSIWCTANYGADDLPNRHHQGACPYEGQICEGRGHGGGIGRCVERPNIMGVYGPDRTDPNTRKDAGDIVNSYLSSNPAYDTSQYYYDTKKKGGGYVVKDTVNNQTSANSINPNGINAIKYNAMAALVKKTTQNFSVQSVVEQMIVSKVDTKLFDTYLTQMRITWETMFRNTCKAGIGGFGYTGINKDISTKEFSGNTQYCKSWVNTKENRSGVYSSYSVDAFGNSIPIKSKTIPLNNVSVNSRTGAPMTGCDTPIPSTRSDDFQVGGSGYCICNSGTLKRGLVDNGHPVFTCNEVCSPENDSVSSVLYYNSKNWQAPLGFSYGKSVKGNNATDPPPPGKNRARAVKPDTTGSFCGTFDVDYMIEGTGGKAYGVEWGSEYVKNYNAVDNPRECPTGMIQDGEVKLSDACSSKKQIDEDQILGIRWSKLTTRRGSSPEEKLAFHEAYMKDGTSVPGYERKCKYEPNGYNVPLINNVDKLKPLPSKVDLLNACAQAPYENLYLDILELNLLAFLADTKASIIYKAIKETYSGSRATALKKTELGKEIFKNMAIYENAYNKLRKLKNSQGLMSAILEDVGLKKGSNDISYYIWLTMAAGAAALALTKYNS
tara:strand:+ start:2981 stop:5500 length:2520 start_codon:yes stop_codon:yes gene_type:complete